LAAVPFGGPLRYDGRSPESIRLNALLPRSVCLSDSGRVAPSAAGWAGSLPQQREIESALYPATRNPPS